MHQLKSDIVFERQVNLVKSLRKISRVQRFPTTEWFALATSRMLLRLQPFGYHDLAIFCITIAFATG